MAVESGGRKDLDYDKLLFASCLRILQAFVWYTQSIVVRPLDLLYGYNIRYWMLGMKTVIMGIMVRKCT